MHIGFVGLGKMGGSMAPNILKGGQQAFGLFQEQLFRIK